MSSGEQFGRIETTFRELRRAGRKLLVPYITGGISDDWLDVVRELAANGADAIEIGIPFSDPMIDGPIIQEASQRSLARGTTPQTIIALLEKADVSIPLLVMTYANIVARAGWHRMARRLADGGIAGVILPDLPLEEAREWMHETELAGLENVMLVAPTSPDDRLQRICAATRGFVYTVGLLGVTGERDALAATSTAIATHVKAVTDHPVLVGIGISTADQAATVCQSADGAIIGSALVRRLLEGYGPREAGEFVATIRQGIDSMSAGL